MENINSPLGESLGLPHFLPRVEVPAPHQQEFCTAHLTIRPNRATDTAWNKTAGMDSPPMTVASHTRDI